MPPHAPDQRMTVKHAVLALLRGFGIDTVFGNPGSTELPFLDSWPNDFRYILGLQEAAVVAMADGYAQATHNAGIVNLHSAAGVGHALGNIHTAYRNQTPLVITAGQQSRALLPMNPFLFSEQATEFPKPYVKWSCEPARAEDVPAAIARAYHIAMQRPRGPTFVSIPSDDWAAETHMPPLHTVAYDIAPDTSSIAALAAALNTSSRPVLVVGAQIDLEGVWNHAIALAETLNAAVWVAPFSHRCSFPEDHPLFQGFLPAAPEAVSAALEPYDTIVVLGAPVFTFHVAGDCALFARDCALFQITDDPAAAARAAMGTSIVASLRLALPPLLALLTPSRRLPPPLRAAAIAPEPSSPIAADYLMHVLGQILPQDSVLVEEAPSHRPAMQQHLRFRRPGSFNTMASGGLGYALPAAIGIALAGPKRRVTCLIGDGSVLYTFQALWTAVQHNLPVTVVVLNNRGYGAMRSFSQVLGVNNAPGIDVPGIDFVQLAGGLGCKGVRISDPLQLNVALRDLYAARGPNLVEVIVDESIPHLYTRKERT